MPLLRSSLIATTCLFAVSAHAGPCGAEFESQHAPLYPLHDEAQWGYVGADGEWRLAPRWRQVRPFSEGRAAVETEAGWGLIDHGGAYIVPPESRDADAVVIDETPYPLSPFKPFSEGCSAATPAGGTPHFITHDGTRWEPPAFIEHDILDIGAFSEGLAWVRVARDDDSDVGWINTEGEWAIEPGFHDGGDFSAGRAPAAMSDTNWGYIDTDGDLVLPRKFVLSHAAPYSEGLAPVGLGGEVGYLDTRDWAIREIHLADGTRKAMSAAGSFAEGLAPVREAKPHESAPVWINREGRVVIDPESGSRHTLCHPSRLVPFHDGLLPLTVAAGGNFCHRDQPPNITYTGPGDPRSGPASMLWPLAGARSKLVWLDPAGRQVIDATACRRPPGTAPLPATTDKGELAPAAYRMALTGMAEGASGPARADAPCNASTFALAGSDGSNAEGPWRLSLIGEADWQDQPVRVDLSIQLPVGLSEGTHEVVPFPDDANVTAILHMSPRQVREYGAERPDSYISKDGTLTLTRLDQQAASGELAFALTPLDAPEKRIRVTAEFHEIPYEPGPEISVLETTGAMATLEEEIPDPLVNFFQPLSARENDDALIVSLGEYGPNLTLTFPAGFSGAFSAGPEKDVTATFAGEPIEAEGELAREAGRVAGQLKASIRSHSQLDGEAGITLRFSHLPVASASRE